MRTLANLGETKIDNLEIRTRILGLENEVFRLKVTVYHLHMMAVVYRLEDLSEHMRCILLREVLLLDNSLKQFTPGADPFRKDDIS